MRKIRIANIVHSIAYGGAETVVLNWLRTLDARRFDARLLCFRDRGAEQPFAQAAARAGIELEYIPWGRNKPVIQASNFLLDYVGRHKIDIVHAYSYHANIQAVLLKLRTRVKIVTTIWMWGKLGWKRSLFQLSDRIMLPLFDSVTAQSEDAKRETARFLPERKSVQLLICGYPDDSVFLEPQERVRWRAAFGAGPDNLVMINVARFYPEKAHDALVAGFEQIHSTHPAARLWLLGVGPELERIRESVRQRGLESSVLFAGFSNDLPSMLAIADIQVHPSRVEGLPLAVCAGMSAGLPVVATSVGGIPEVIRHEETGLLVPPGDVPAFVAAVQRLLDHPEERARFGASARRFLVEQYSLAMATRRLEDVYMKLAPELALQSDFTIAGDQAL